MQAKPNLFTKQNEKKWTKQKKTTKKKKCALELFIAKLICCHFDYLSLCLTRCQRIYNFVFCWSYFARISRERLIMSISLTHNIFPHIALCVFFFRPKLRYVWRKTERALLRNTDTHNRGFSRTHTASNFGNTLSYTRAWTTAERGERIWMFIDGSHHLDTNFLLCDTRIGSIRSAIIVCVYQRYALCSSHPFIRMGMGLLCDCGGCTRGTRIFIQTYFSACVGQSRRVCARQNIHQQATRDGVCFWI